MKFLIKIYNKDKTIIKSWTRKKSKFRKILRSINFQNNVFKTYLRVDYGMGVNNFKKWVMFYNDGFYNSHKDLISAFIIFTEKGLL